MFLVSRSPRNKMTEMHRLESTADLCSALDRVHELIQLMQGSSHIYLFLNSKCVKDKSGNNVYFCQTDQTNFPSLSVALREM